METYKTVKRFAWKNKTLSDGKIIIWKFYYEDRKYEKYVDLDKYNKQITTGFLVNGYIFV